MTPLPLLSVLVFAPWIGALVLAACPRANAGVVRAVTLGFSLSTLVLALSGLAAFDSRDPGLQFSETHAWIPSLGITFHLGMDGLSLTLVLLTGLLAPACLLASRKISGNVRLFGLLFLVLQGSALGVFLTLDFFPWFVFWELSLVPIFFLLRLWGGPGAGRAAYQFVVYTIGGSAFMLLGFAALYAATGTVDFTRLAALAADGTLARDLALLGPVWPRLVFAGILLGFAVKVPLFPFHTWLPAAYAEAPTGVSMFLTGVVSKMGVYGFLRILWPLFPHALHAAATPLIVLALCGVVFSAFAALRQTDLKRMVAYSSINHLSLCLLALFAVCAATGGRHAAAGGPLTGAVPSSAEASALTGVIVQLFNHGLSAAALFYCVGLLADRSGGRRGIGDFGGVRTAAPYFAAICGLSLFSSIGLPGLNGFVGEFLIFRGVFGLVPWAAGAACLGLLATALFLLTFWQRVFHGPARGAGVGFRDASLSEGAVLAPALFLMVLLGVAPQVLTGLFNPLVADWVSRLTAAS